MQDYRRIAEDFARHLRVKYGSQIEQIILFGSVARGEQREESDVDLLIVTPGDWFALQHDVAGDAVDWLGRTGVYISAKVFSASDFARLGETGFGRAVVYEGVTLA